ncbi:MAG: polyprenyl synthetase family protein [Dehalococcoidia bacterium]|nr:polyprenyl synthetase family protein [Dehalococcoidia bacterium]
MELEEIYQLVEEDLAKVRRQIDSVTEVDSPHLAEMLRHVLGGGKGIRPALTLLAGKFYRYNLDLLLSMATGVELMHTATLVHDDAIDKSSVRRGRSTVNEVWGEERAVLLGDYVFARAGEFAADTGNLRVIILFSQTLQTITSGEIVQTNDAFKLEQTRPHYLERIASKTASLFSLSTISGAILSDAPEDSVKILRDYGFNLGVAFQIVDDILDFVGTEEEMGKPIGSDLLQGTLTLPAMLLLEQYPDDNPVKELFANPNMPDKDKREKIGRAIELVGRSPIAKQCYQLALDYCDKACRDLGKLPAKPSRQALMDLADLVISRKK